MWTNPHSHATHAPHTSLKQCYVGWNPLATWSTRRWTKRWSESATSPPRLQDASILHPWICNVVRVKKVATSGRSGGILHTSWPWLLTMAEAAAPIPGTQAAPGCGKRQVQSPPLCAFSCSHLHPRPLVHGLLAFDLVFLCHLPWLNPFLYAKSKISFSAPNTLALKRGK